MNNDCPTCAALWRDYAAATHAHITLESKLEIARLTHDDATAKLSSEEEAASTNRVECRRLMEEHERNMHSPGMLG